jgi:hypothetical protein
VATSSSGPRLAGILPLFVGLFLRAVRFLTSQVSYFTLDLLVWSTKETKLSFFGLCNFLT